MKRLPHPAALWLSCFAAMAPLQARPPADSVVVFNELHYHPPGGASEWLELHNQMGVNMDLSGWRLTGGVDFTFPDGTVIPGNGFLVIAAAPAAVPGSIGPWSGALDNGGETVTLRDRNSRLMDEISFSDGEGWPQAPDGCGHTLSKRTEDLASFAAENWTSSAEAGGTPAAANFPGGEPVQVVALNEISSSLAAAGGFFVELVNRSAAPANLDGLRIRSTSGGEAPLSGVLGAGALSAVTEPSLGFRPAAGEILSLQESATGRVLDALRVSDKDQARDAQFRWQQPDIPTPELPNVVTVSNAVVINEIMYHHMPVFLPTGTTEDPEEWIELFNRSGAAVNLSGWKLGGGIDFTFAPATMLAPGGYVVVAKNAAALNARFPGLGAVGNFSGSLSNHDDTVRLLNPKGNTANEIHYFHGGRWDARADGGGSSLELKNPDGDSSSPEVWAASDESAKSSWQNFSHQGGGANPAGSINPTQWNEFVIGLLGSGEFLIDDISVREVSSGNRELIQDGTFADGGVGEWRLLGTHGDHGASGIADDPVAAGNKVLRVVATDETEPVYNHVETTLKSGASFVTLSDAATYSVSFRARWISGSPRLSTRLYFNRLSRQSLLPVPPNNGTPGAQNSRFEANTGPAFSGLEQSPVLPTAGSPVTIRVRISDPQGVASASLNWRTDGAAWTSVPMTISSGVAEGIVAGQSAGTLAQFYVEATDVPGAAAAYPAAGAASRALAKWRDATNPSGPGHGFRLLMLPSDADELHDVYRAASNLVRPCTVVYREKEIFHDAGIRLRSSLFGRTASVRLGYSLSFDPMHPFRGNYESVNLDRSGYGRGTDNTSRGISEIINWAVFNRAGGVPSMHNDLVWILAPRSTENGPAILTLAEFNDTYLDSQYDNGSDGPVFRYDRIYYPTSATGSVEGPKPATPNANTKVSLRSLDTPDDKENYRWNFPITNARRDDNYARMINLNQTFRMTGAAYAAALPDAIDIDQWLRTSAAMALIGIGDNYATDSAGFYRQNLKLHARADGRMIYLPWDTDFLTDPFNAPVIANFDLQKMIDADPRWERTFFGHLHAIIGAAFNTASLTPWVTHYQTFSSGGNWSEILTYTTQRTGFVQAEINARFPATPFAITTNGGDDFASPDATVLLAGDGWIDVVSISLAEAAEPLPLTWTDKDSWQVLVPVQPGVNGITLQARDWSGAIVGTDSISITATGGITPASAANLVISELHYHPAAATPAEAAAGFPNGEDFEFIELRNIGSGPIDLSGCRFTDGIAYSFAAGTRIAAGDCLVVPRRSAACSLRHPGLDLAPEYFIPDANLFSNGGEVIVLTDAGGHDIQRFHYRDAAPWPEAPDGGGPSLVLIAPQANPDPDNPLNWRPSRTAHGNPCASDALLPVANPSEDDNANGVANLIDRALPGGFSSGNLSVGATDVTLHLTRQSWLDAAVSVETSADLLSWHPAAPSEISRQTGQGGLEILTLVLPTDAGRNYFRIKVLQ